MATKKQLLGADNHNLIEAYKNNKFGDFVKALEGHGHKLELDDFLVMTKNSHGRQMEIGQLFADMSATAQMFVPELWVGNVETIQKLHARYISNYGFSAHDINEFVAKIPGHKPAAPAQTVIEIKSKYKLDVDSTKRRILDYSGDGFFSELLKASASTSKLEALRARLNEAGYDFGIEEFRHRAYGKFPNLICNSGDGDEVSPAYRLDYLLPILAENGQRFTLEDWAVRFTTNGRDYTVISYLARHEQLGKLFIPAYWAHHLDEMDKVWAMVPDLYKRDLNYTAARAEAEALMKPAFVIPARLTKSVLFHKGEDNQAPFDDRRTWKQFDQIIATLEKNGKSLKKTDLLKTNAKGTPYITVAAEFGMLETVALYLANNKEALTLDEVAELKLEKYYTSPAAILTLVNRRHPDVTTPLPGNQSLLQIAVKENDLVFVQRVAATLRITNKAKPDLYLKALNTVSLDPKAEEGASPINDYLLGEKNNVLAKIGDFAVFLQAAQDGDRRLVKAFLDAGKIQEQINDRASNSGSTALHAAIGNKHNAVAHDLLAAGAAPDATTSRGLSCLSYCATYNPAMASTIIDALKTKYKDKPADLFQALTLSSPYKRARENRNTEVAALILSEVQALIPDIIKLDEKTLALINAKDAFAELGLQREYTKTLEHHPHKRIAVVGTGLDGAAAAISVLSKAQEPLELMLINQPGTKTENRAALTTKPASELSVIYDKPDDFVAWLRNSRDIIPEIYRTIPAQPQQFVPEGLHQIYVETRLQEAIKANATTLLKEIDGEVVDVLDRHDRATLVFKDGLAFDANQVILAPGTPSLNEGKFVNGLKGSKHFTADATSEEAQGQLKLIKKDAPVVILGSGATAYQMTADLLARGHAGEITMISRGGYTPAPKPKETAKAITISRPAFLDAPTLPEFISGLRKDFWEKTNVDGHSPQQVARAYQAYAPVVLQKFPEATIRDLLREHGSLITSLTSTMSPDIVSLVEAARIDGKVKVLAGTPHVLEASETGAIVHYTPAGSSQSTEIQAGHVISALGHKTNSDLWHNMTTHGQVKSHATGLGFRTNAKGQLLDVLGVESNTLIAMGAARIGDRMERGVVGQGAYSAGVAVSQAEEASSLVLTRVNKQKPVTHTEVQVKAETAPQTMVFKDKGGRSRQEISFGTDGKPVDMKVYVGENLLEVHARGENGTISLVRYMDGEAQEAVNRRPGTPGFTSWDDILKANNYQASETGRTKPIILTTAHTGARYSPWQKKEGKDIPIGPNFFAQNMPISPAEIIEDAAKAYAAGSRFIHVHARNPETGEQHADLNWYKTVTAGIRERCEGAVISFPTSRKGEVGKEIDALLKEMPPVSREEDIERRIVLEAKIRASGIEALPDTLTTFTVPEMKIFGDDAIKDKRGVEDVPGWNDTTVMQGYFKRVNQRAAELGVNQEIEITTIGEFDILDRLVKEGKEYGFKGPFHVVLILGFSNGLPIDRETYEESLKRIDDLRESTGTPITISCGAVIRPNEAAEKPVHGDLPKGKHDYKEVMQWVAEDNRVDAFRVGLEDTPKLYGQQQTNPSLVEHARAFFESKNISIETDPATVRRAFNLGSNFSQVSRPADKVMGRAG